MFSPSKSLKLLLLGLLIAVSTSASAEPLLLAESPVSDQPRVSSEITSEEHEDFSIHSQATYIFQQKNSFNSPYSGSNSLLSKVDGDTSNSYTFSGTLFLGTRLWEGAEIFYNPEVFQGLPFSGQLIGLGGFQNGELQKGAFTSPVFYSARAFVRQTIGLGGDQEHIESSANQLAGKVDKNRLVFSYGKFSSLDFFDQNTYSHDPRTQFQNFALFSMAAYSYAADPKGFTFGLVGEWYQDDWIVRAARLALPKVPNTEQMDYSLGNNFTNQIELTHQHSLFGQTGAVRALYYQQRAYMASYQDAINLGQQSNTAPDILSVRQSGQETWGYGFNVEQAINKDIGIFARWSWNPGNVETQTLDVSRSLSFGVSVKGTSWNRPMDTFGAGYATNGISSTQINYLKQGGYTAFIGDGNINYKNEEVIELYYSAKIYKNFYMSADFQRIANPAYNSDRGPINFFGVRAHIEM